MPDFSVHKANELARDERILIERWLGRPLGEDETIGLNAFRPHLAPAGPDLEELRRQIVAQAMDIGSRAPVADEEEAAALVDEALSTLRGRRG